ncbi:phosphatidylcholine/phosphatidylserine synthase [Allosphingosinicella flava]|uniref:Phosphatidylcholine/phosphatidylserine synthase n=1 Tax=Allosphingosinicella flava TaxID=2771430 RepID=A0A7T2GKU9_9SPHN|nr:phosphatidylcholine/phosphatidylserine synthase [Sphingosinicella flava]QPQ55726.1 phosphatidylcholine/phosphatidylserine synthase [Sphingosinicella flava]
MTPARAPSRRGIPLRALIPNAVTALALCFGLTGVRFAIAGQWEQAVAAIIFAGVLDGMDGRIARALKGQSRFGAELDSLSDVIAFGVSPAIVIYLWSLQHLPKFGWVFALAHVVCQALRLARFNANIDVEDQPHKSAGFLTGVPAPAGAGLVLLPLILWMWTGISELREVYVVAPWTALVAFLLVSNLATYSWTSFRLRSHMRLGALVAIALVGAALVSAPWPTLGLISIVYVLLIPFSIASYRKVRRQRAAAAR